MTALERAIADAKEELRREYLLDPDMNRGRWIAEEAVTIFPYSPRVALGWAQDHLFLGWKPSTGHSSPIEEIQNNIYEYALDELNTYNAGLEKERKEIASSIEEYAEDNYEEFLKEAKGDKATAIQWLIVDACSYVCKLDIGEEPEWVKDLVEELVEDLEEDANAKVVG